MVSFDPSVLLRGDIKTRYEAMQLARNMGLKNVDELRAGEELPPLPDGLGQGYIQPVNYAPLGFDPALVPMPKSVQGGTDETGTVPQTPPKGEGQQPEPPGIGNSRSTQQCQLGPDGRPHYYDPHTGEPVQEEK